MPGPAASGGPLFVNDLLDNRQFLSLTLLALSLLQLLSLSIFLSLFLHFFIFSLFISLSISLLLSLSLSLFLPSLPLFHYIDGLRPADREIPQSRSNGPDITHTAILPYQPVTTTSIFSFITFNFLTVSQSAAQLFDSPPREQVVNYLHHCGS